MKSTLVALSLALLLHAVTATKHTLCYNYFMEKDKCVFTAAASDQRCDAPPKVHSAPVPAIHLNPHSTKPKGGKDHRLERRFDTTKPSFSIGGGDGICGFYNSTTELGVCLWSGPEQKNPTINTAGWLNGLKPSNCGKRIYIQRKGRPETVQFVKVLDGCGFNIRLENPGCFEVGLTVKLFNLFNPTPQEQKDGLIYGGITWDFDNLHNTHTQQAPV